MSSGGKKQQTTTSISTNDPPSWSVPYFQSLLTQTQNVMKRPYQGYGGPTQAGFSDDQLASFDMVRQQADQNAASQGLASNYLQGTIQGQGANPYLGQTTGTNPYAGENQYLDQMIADSQGDVTRAYTDSTLPSYLSQFNAGGAYGGSAMQQALQGSQRELAGQLGRVSTSLRSADYDRQAQLAESALNRQQTDIARNAGLYGQEQANRLQAIGMLPQIQQAGYRDATALSTIGAQQQDLYQRLIDDDRDQFLEARDWDRNNLGLLANALGTIRGGSSSSSQTGANPNYRSAGENAASYAAILASLWGS